MKFFTQKLITVIFLIRKVSWVHFRKLLNTNFCEFVKKSQIAKLSLENFLLLSRGVEKTTSAQKSQFVPCLQHFIHHTNGNDFLDAILSEDLAVRPFSYKSRNFLLDTNRRYLIISDFHTSQSKEAGHTRIQSLNC